MKESIKWDDSRDDIMDIIVIIEDNEKPRIPLRCPICNTDSAHIYICIVGKMKGVQYGLGVVIVNHVHMQAD